MVEGVVFNVHSVFLLFWQGEIERGAFVGFGFGPDESPVAVEDALLHSWLPLSPLI